MEVPTKAMKKDALPEFDKTKFKNQKEYIKSLNKAERIAFYKKLND